MDITFFLNTIVEAVVEMGELNPFLLFVEILRRGGWIPIVVMLFLGAAHIWLDHRQALFAHKQKYVLLAIDIPPENEQTPRAVENMMVALAGAHGSIDWYERWWKGEWQEGFSLELVSIEGYVQFLIRTNVNFRDLTEAAVFAQYPNAEITEVSDYCDDAPKTFPHDEYEMFGAEYKLHKKNCYPIRIYKNFEHTLSGTFADPMASMIEVMSNLARGEQLWYQIIIRPVDDTWQDEGIEEVKKLVGAPEEKKVTLIDKALAIPAEIVSLITEAFFPEFASTEEKHEQSKPRSEMLFLTSGEKSTVEAIEGKISKIGFSCKIRFIYFAKKEVYLKSRGAAGFIGAIKQFNTLDLNNFRPEKKSWTKTYYFLKKQRMWARQRLMMNAYRSRSYSYGVAPYVLNVEELATIWHFPAKEVTTPMLKTAAGRKAEAPVDLPVTIEREPSVDDISASDEAKPETTIDEPPIDLPIIKD